MINVLGTVDLAVRAISTRVSNTPYRAQLIKKGLVYAPERGLIVYALPRMASFAITRQLFVQLATKKEKNSSQRAEEIIRAVRSIGAALSDEH